LTVVPKTRRTIFATTPSSSSMTASHMNGRESLDRLLEQTARQLVYATLILMNQVIAALVFATTLAQSSQPGPGPAVGSTATDFAATDQVGRTRNLSSLLGPNGALLVFFRSADW
jgi:hypothetical protein